MRFAGTAAAAGFAIQLDLSGADRVQDGLEAVADHMRDLEPPFRQAFDVLEREHARHFAALNGRYVLSGATRASLTGSGGEAVRLATARGLVFGTEVDYAVYLSRREDEPYRGQVERGDHQSAVLVFSERSQKQVAELLMGYITEPFGA